MLLAVKTMQVRKTRAIGVDGEHRAIDAQCRSLLSSHTGCCPIESNWPTLPPSLSSNLMQDREGLGCHPARRYQVEPGDQRGQEE